MPLMQGMLGGRSRALWEWKNEVQGTCSRNEWKGGIALFGPGATGQKGRSLVALPRSPPSLRKNILMGDCVR